MVRRLDRSGFLAIPLPADGLRKRQMPSATGYNSVTIRVNGTARAGGETASGERPRPPISNGLQQPREWFFSGLGREFRESREKAHSLQPDEMLSTSPSDIGLKAEYCDPGF